MERLAIFALAGFLAQMVDGSLGMAYGVTSSSLLLAAGTAPAVASASVHLAEIGTSLASGASHWRFGNVDWKVVRRIAIPGAIGAFAGATLLSSLSTETAAPWMAALLIGLGIYIVFKFTKQRSAAAAAAGRHPGRRFLAPLGLVAGFVDASGGGGWGPISTSTLLSSGRMDVRKTIGSVNTSEFLVTVAASVGFIIGLGTEAISFGVVAALLVGGVIAAPFGAWLVRHIPARVLGAGVGGLIVLTNAKTVLDAVGLANPWPWVVYAGVLALWAAALTIAVQRLRRDRAVAQEAVPEPV